MFRLGYRIILGPSRCIWVLGQAAMAGWPSEHKQSTFLQPGRKKAQVPGILRGVAGLLPSYSDLKPWRHL